MKPNNKFHFLFLLLLSLHFAGTAQITGKYLASCCDKKGGRCTGSGSCTACTNCSRCKHCSNGGSCGVCSNSKQEVVKYKEKEKKTGSGTRTKTVIVTESKKAAYYKDQPVFITEAYVNLRQGPGAEHQILEKVKKGNRVIFLERNGKWSKVRVEKTGTIGYVERDHLQ